MRSSREANWGRAIGQLVGHRWIGCPKTSVVASGVVRVVVGDGLEVAPAPIVLLPTLLGPVEAVPEVAAVVTYVPRMSASRVAAVNTDVPVG